MSMLNHESWIMIQNLNFLFLYKNFKETTELRFIRASPLGGGGGAGGTTRAKGFGGHDTEKLNFILMVHMQVCLQVEAPSVA